MVQPGVSGGAYRSLALELQWLRPRATSQEVVIDRRQLLDLRSSEPQLGRRYPSEVRWGLDLTRGEVLIYKPR